MLDRNFLAPSLLVHTDAVEKGEIAVNIHKQRLGMLNLNFSMQIQSCFLPNHIRPGSLVRLCHLGKQFL
jgi:hypothetical protein